MKSYEKESTTLKFDTNGGRRSVYCEINRPRNMKNVIGYMDYLHGFGISIRGDFEEDIEKMVEGMCKRGYVCILKDFSGTTPLIINPDSGEHSREKDMNIHKASYGLLEDIINTYNTPKKCKFSVGTSYGAYISIISSYYFGLDYNAIAAIDPIFSFRNVIEERINNAGNDESQKMLMKFQEIAKYLDGKKIVEGIFYRIFAIYADYLLRGNELSRKAIYNYLFREKTFWTNSIHNKILDIKVNNPKLFYHEIMHAPRLYDPVKGFGTPIGLFYFTRGIASNGVKPFDEDKKKKLKEKWSIISKDYKFWAIGDDDGPDHLMHRSDGKLDDENLNLLADMINKFFQEHSN